MSIYSQVSPKFCYVTIKTYIKLNADDLYSELRQTPRWIHVHIEEHEWNDTL